MSHGQDSVDKTGNILLINPFLNLWRMKKKLQEGNRRQKKCVSTYLTTRDYLWYMIKIK